MLRHAPCLVPFQQVGFIRVWMSVGCFVLNLFGLLLQKDLSFVPLNRLPFPPSLLSYASGARQAVPGRGA